MAIKGISCSALRAQHILPTEPSTSSTGDPQKNLVPRSRAEKKSTSLHGLSRFHDVMLHTTNTVFSRVHHLASHCSLLGRPKVTNLIISCWLYSFLMKNILVVHHSVVNTLCGDIIAIAKTKRRGPLKM